MLSSVHRLHNVKILELSAHFLLFVHRLEAFFERIGLIVVAVALHETHLHLHYSSVTTAFLLTRALPPSNREAATLESSMKKVNRELDRARELNREHDRAPRWGRLNEELDWELDSELPPALKTRSLLKKENSFVRALADSYRLPLSATPVALMSQREPKFYC
ncbi:hypothetical protein L1887_61439 [Cichorium endivia]|nr:hypothetical protein L1887_61439 [Cichorium endivia]